MTTNDDLVLYEDGPAALLAGLAGSLPPIAPAELWQVMERQIALYTNLDSSSVPEETAAELLESVLFCVATACKEAANGGMPPPAPKGESPAGAGSPDIPLAAWLLAGQRALAQKHGAGLRLQRRAQATSLPLQNPMYRDALAGTKLFFTWYDIRFMAHQVPCDIDYPPALPVSEALKGIDYISQYLRQRIWEDAFCRAFPLSRVLAVLARFSPYWQAMPYNLFEPVFGGALGGALLGQEAPSLCRNGEDRRALWASLRPLTGEQLAVRLARAATTLCNQLHIWGSAQRAYYGACAAALAPRILAADRQGFAHIFL